MSGPTETGEEQFGQVSEPEPHELALDATVPPSEPAIEVPLAAALLVAVAIGFGFWAMTHFSAPSNLASAAPPATASSPLPGGVTADSFIDLSARLYREKRFVESADAALQAIRLKPDSAVAWNNRAASLNELGRWDEAIAAGRTAVQLKPDFELARNNLAWAIAAKSGHK